VPKISATHLTVLMGHRLVTVRQTDRQTDRQWNSRNVWQSLAYSPLGTAESALVNTYEKHLLTDHVSA